MQMVLRLQCFNVGTKIVLKLQASEESVPWRDRRAEPLLPQNEANDGVSCKLKNELMMRFTAY